MRAWIERAGQYRVERIDCPHGSLRVDMTRPRAGVVHTVEGGWNAGMDVFRQHYAPHFLVGPGRIAQLVPLGTAASALENRPGGVETNAWAVAQIEVTGYSRKEPYSFNAMTTSALAALLATLRTEAGIPLNRPFPESMPPPWWEWTTAGFSRRVSGKWGTRHGWFGHVEVPENGHWDPGALEWNKLLRAARALDDGKRKAVLRAWVLAYAGRFGWAAVKKTANWREYRRLGGQ